MGIKARTLGLTSALACALLVAACGGGDGNDEPPANSGATIATVPASAPGAGLPSPVAAAATTAAGAGGTGSAATAPAGGAAGAAGADATFTNFKNQFTTVRSYRMSTLVETQGQRMEMTIDMQLPDRYKVSMTGGSPIPIEVIGIANQTYVKAGPIWQATGAANTLPFQPNQLATQMQGFANSPNVVKGATMSVGGASCTVYTVTSPQGQKADICIGADSLPRQIKYTDAATTFTATFSMFNANFNIVAPI